jgi:hypothetical protein
MKRDRIEVEPVRPGQRSKLDKNARKERGVLQRAHHLPVACGHCGKIVHPGGAVGKTTRNLKPSTGLTEITSIITFEPHDREIPEA